MAVKKSEPLKNFIESVNKSKSKQNGLKVVFNFVKRKRH